MARDEAFATPQIGYVALGSSKHGNVIGNALFNGCEALIVIGAVFNRSFNRAHALGKKIDPAANPDESAHKSDKQNGCIEDGSESYSRVKCHQFPLHWLRYVNSFSNKRFLTPELAVIDPSPFATTTGV
jgi:hypothetical protein